MKPKKLFGPGVFPILISAAFMAALCAIAFVYDAKAGIFSSALFCCYIAFIFLYSYFGTGDSKRNSAGKALASHTFDFLSAMQFPVLICDNEGNISWYNDALRDLYPDAKIKVGEPAKVIGEAAVLMLDYAANPEGKGDFFLTKCDDRFFDVYPYALDINRKSYYFAVWDDATLLENLTNEHKNANVLVGYAVVDNISEVSQGLQEKYRQTSAKIADALSEWVGSMNGIIKEYERDKYIIFIEDRYLDSQIEAKFDILDKVYALSENDETVPLTVSFGLSRINGSLSEKEETAKISLQLALQRGGAQVVVKTKADNEFYGGKTKTVQKRSKIKSRVEATKLVNLIKNSENVLVMGHMNPDFDAIASAVGIARMAMFFQKEVKIVTDLSNQNFVMCSPMLSGIREYDTMFIDKVYGQELLTPNTLLVITDVSNERIFESADIYRNAEHVAIIDHHRQSQEFDKPHDITYIEPSASSASELICEMLEIVCPPDALRKEEAELLLAGILLDTQNFSRNVGVRTFSAAVYLRGAGANTVKAQTVFKYQLTEMKKLAEFEKNITVFRKIFAISSYDLDNKPENRIIAAQAAERMMLLSNIKASFTLALDDDAICVSGRSDGGVNVSLILEKIGGGGHFDSAGARLTGISMKEATAKLRDAVSEYCDSQ